MDPSSLLDNTPPHQPLESDFPERSGDKPPTAPFEYPEHHEPPLHIAPQPGRTTHHFKALRQPSARKKPTILVMSLAGLKNLFFRQTVTPIPQHSKYLSHVSERPLLSHGAPSNNNAEHTETSDDETTDVDVESQQGLDTQIEKANSRRGFRIDARIISDATIGLSDGLTVPFALTAGLSALGSTNIVIYGGFAELGAGAISMGLGGYLGAKSEAASYNAKREEVQQLVDTDPRAAIESVASAFENYGLSPHTLGDLTGHFVDSPHLVDFIMQFQHCEEPPAASRALTSAITISVAYFLGGLLPLLPYLCVDSDQVFQGLYISIGVMVVALFLFGYIKTCVVVGWSKAKHIRAACFGGIQMVVVGSTAAAIAMGLVRLFSQDERNFAGH